MSGTLPLLAACAMLGAAPDQDAGVEAPISADAVVERAIEAMGGRTAFEKLESHFMKVTKYHMSGTNRRESPFEFWFITPDKVKAVQHSPIGPVVMAFDGQRGWTKPGMMKTQPTGLESMAPVTDIARMPRLAFDLEREFEIDPSVTIVTFDDHPCYRLTLKRRMPRKRETERSNVLLVDVETGRPRGLLRPSRFRTAEITDTLRFKEWKSFGDYTLFTQIYSDEPGQPEYHVEEFEANQVDAAAFTPPADLEDTDGG